MLLWYDRIFNHNRTNSQKLAFPKRGDIVSRLVLVSTHYDFLSFFYRQTPFTFYSRANQDFFTAKAKNVAYSSRNFSDRCKTLRRNSNVFFLLFLAGEGEGQTLSSLSLFCLSLSYSVIDPSMGSHETDRWKIPGV